MKNRNIREANEPGVDVFTQSGINKKLNNLMGFDDFEKTFEPKKQRPTKRTDVGLDVINEQREEDYLTITLDGSNTLKRSFMNELVKLTQQFQGKITIKYSDESTYNSHGKKI
jgi:hypothetical protein